MTLEGGSKRCKTSSCRPITPRMDEKENHWNRMSLIRLRYHPCLRLPRDPYIPYQYTAMAPSFAVIKDGISVKGGVGLGSIEIQVDGQYVTHLEFPFYGAKASPPPQDYILTTPHIAELIHGDPKKRKVTITAVGTDQRQAELQDYSELSRTSKIVVDISQDGPAAPIPTSSAFKSKLKLELGKFGKRHDNHVASTSSSTHGKTMEVVKGIPVGSEKPQNPSFQFVFNSVKGSKPLLTRVDVSQHSTPPLACELIHLQHGVDTQRICT